MLPHADMLGAHEESQRDIQNLKEMLHFLRLREGKEIDGRMLFEHHPNTATSSSTRTVPASRMLFEDHPHTPTCIAACVCI
jgi:hypothetical protein